MKLIEELKGTVLVDPVKGTVYRVVERDMKPEYDFSNAEKGKFHQKENATPPKAEPETNPYAGAVMVFSPAMGIWGAELPNGSWARDHRANVLHFQTLEEGLAALNLPADTPTRGEERPATPETPPAPEAVVEPPVESTEAPTAEVKTDDFPNEEAPAEHAVNVIHRVVESRKNPGVFAVRVGLENEERPEPLRDDAGKPVLFNSREAAEAAGRARVAALGGRS